MDFSDVIKKRYSCKKYDGRPVAKEQLDAILAAGRLAPTARNLQEHHIYVLQTKESLAKFDSASPCRYGAATVLVVAFHTDNVYTYPGGLQNSGTEDATIVASHLMLAATNAGVDNCWINKLDPMKLKEVLGLPENETIVMALDLGYAAEGAGPLPHHFSRKDLSETVSYL